MILEAAGFEGLLVNGKQIPYVAIAGENKLNDKKITLKNMTTGEQQLLDLLDFLSVAW